MEWDATHFADDADGSECDFVQERRDGSHVAVQVSWELSDENEVREFAGAVHAMDRLGLKEALLVAHAQSDLVNIGGRRIKVVPAHEYLSSKGDVAQ